MSFFSCKEKPPDYVVNDFIYLNSTTFAIELTAYCKGSEFPYSIPVGEESKIRINGGETNRIIVSDSLLIEYISSGSTMFYDTSADSNNPIRLENYQHKQITENHHEFTFEFK